MIASLLAVAAIALGVLAPGSPDQKPETFYGEATVRAERRADVTEAERTAITTTLQRFFATGLTRTDLAAAWDLAAPPLRAASTRPEWLAGDVPFVEYHADQFGSDAWQAVDVTDREVVLELLVQPAPDWLQGPATFAIDVLRVGTEWRVASAYPQVLFSRDGEYPTVFSEKDLQASGPATPRRVEARLGTGWLLVPILLFTGLLVALAAAIVRERRRR